MPRTGPCSPWVNSTTLRTMPELTDTSEEFLVNAALVATDILYHLSGAQFTGASCGPVTVRPVSRPVDSDSRGMSALSPMGYFSSWGSCSFSGFGHPGIVSHYGCSRPPEIYLGAYPVTAISTVYIDGVLIPSTEYQLQDFRTLVRTRPTVSATPTERYGWPTCQDLTLPDTQPGTFSVTYTYGVAPPSSGVLAAKVLGKNLALSMEGSENDLPIRTTSINRQGISAVVTDVMDFLAKGQTGIYEVDLFLRVHNQHGLRRQSKVWSPDRGRARRVAT